MRTDAFTAELASGIVRDHGLASIWKLNIIAAETYRNGCPKAAAAILEVADAVERRWMLQQSSFHNTDTRSLIEACANSDRAAGRSAYAANATSVGR
jgi:hypothetical protein